MEFIEYVALVAIIIGAIIFASPLIKKSKYKVVACSIYEIGVVIQFIVAVQEGVMLFIITGIIFFFVNLMGIILGLKGK